MAQNYIFSYRGAMSMKYSLTKETREKLQQLLKSSKALGNYRIIIRVNAVLSLFKDISIDTIAFVLNVSTESISNWFKLFLSNGVDGLKDKKKSPGRPNKLTEPQKQELLEIIIAGPENAGYIGACWRTPMIRDIIINKFGVDFSVKYLS